MVTTTLAFIDWIMSLEPDWYSTIYPWLFTVGEVLLTFAFMIALLVLFSKHEPFAAFVKTQHYHDLGNLMLAFTMLWAYMGLAQFLIIWAENLPDEIPWYIRRFSGGWGYMAWFISIFHFCVPFFLLLMRFVKKSPAASQSPGAVDHRGADVGYILVCGARFPRERPGGLLDRLVSAGGYGRNLARILHLELEETPAAGAQRPARYLLQKGAWTLIWNTPSNRPRMEPATSRAR